MSTLLPITPAEYRKDPFAVFDQCKYRVLAQGDSWFSIGSLNPFNSNLLFAIDTPSRIGAVNCAYPGRTLCRMTDALQDPGFRHLLNDRSGNWHWDALFFSGGGNDLIDAVQTTFDAAGGDPAKRLLLRQDEWDAALPASRRYLSEPGWQTFAAHITQVFQALVDARDAPESAAQGSPVFLHTYHFPTPRNAPALPGVAGAWLYQAVTAYAVPAEDWNALADELIARLVALLQGFSSGPGALPGVHVFDSTQVAVARAAPGTTGIDGDWANEIHMTRDGYDKLGGAFGGFIGNVLP